MPVLFPLRPGASGFLRTCLILLKLGLKLKIFDRTCEHISGYFAWKCVMELEGHVQSSFDISVKCEVWSDVKWKVRSTPLLSRERYKWHSSLHHSQPQNLSHSPCYISYIHIIPLQLSHQLRCPSVLMRQYGISENILALFRLQMHVCLSPFVHSNINIYACRLPTHRPDVCCRAVNVCSLVIPHCNVQIQ